MNLNIDTGAILKLAAAAGKAGLPALESAIQIGATAVVAPYGLSFVPALVLPTLFKLINTQLGLDPDTPPDQTAAKIEDDPQAAQTALAALNSQQQFSLDQQKQADDARLAGQAQQTALIATDQTSESWFARSWRPAAGWVCVAGLAIDVLILPIVSYGATIAGHTMPPPPDATQLIALLTAMLGLSITRTATLASQDSVKKAIVAPKAVVHR